MKAPVLCLVLVASAAPFALAAEVAPGATMDEVWATLGAPKGQMQVNGRQVLYFDRGAIELQAGRVTQIALRTPEQHARLMAREERIRAEREAQNSRLMAEGIALRDRKLAEAAFQSAPLAYQVAFWENFARSYPGVPCLEPLTLARLRLNEQLDETRRRQEENDRLAVIEERLAAAERPAEFYPIRTTYAYYGRHHHAHDSGLGPISYHFYSNSLSPYSTPAGNPAGSLAGSVINPPSSSVARTEWDEEDTCGHNTWNDDHRNGRGADHGRGRRSERM